MRIEAALATAATLAAVVATDRGAAWSRAGAAPAPIVVTRDESRAPAGCGPRAVASRLQAFVAGYNRGDRHLDRRLQLRLPGGGRGWFSMTDPDHHDVARTRAAARRLFRARHRRGERLVLRELVVSAIRRRGLVDFEVNLDRSRGDATDPMHAKGAVVCGGGRPSKLGVWSGSTPTAHLALCPPAPAGTPTAAVIACTR